MEKIIPHLWYDKEAREAARLYASVFKDSKVTSGSILEGTPSGEVDMLGIELFGQSIMMMSAGPYFKFTPAVSLMVALDSAQEVDSAWAGLSAGGRVRMPLGAYPFSPRYGWTEDRFGLSWQLMQAPPGYRRRRVVPTLMFTGAVKGKAEEAMGFYSSVFRDSAAGGILRYGEGEGPDAPGTVKREEFSLEGADFAAMDSAYPHGFGFNEALSFAVNCADQAEIDYYWERLSADPAAERCGWLKDRYGLSWQIVPVQLAQMMGGGSAEQAARVTQAFLSMKKFDIAALRAAYGD